MAERSASRTARAHTKLKHSGELTLGRGYPELGVILHYPYNPWDWYIYLHLPTFTIFYH